MYQSELEVYFKLGVVQNYVDKIEGVGGLKMPIIVHIQFEKCPCGCR